MLIPGCIYIFINNYIPMGGLIIAFKKMNYRLGILDSPWVGFKNFEFLFTTKEAWIITRNTILYNLAFIVLGTIIAVGVALLLNQIRQNTARKSYQTIILLPHLISIVVVSYLVFAFLSSESGFVNNSILEPLGIKPISWYSASKYWPFIIVIVGIWKSFGYSCIIYYATLVGIDKSYYEAAVIDGANRWKQMLHITLPGLKSIIIILTLMSISKIFYSDFGLFYQVPMNSGSLIDITNTIDTYVYRGLAELNNVGMASAAGFYQSIVGFLLVLVSNFVVKKIDEESALF
ncbi:ABC transporter permease [Paenibacillus silvisoli]|uniref:ABC transporter permease n=1 Tax=Paenibacillus silvisoli TaxID=3110539 RepID=UPI0028062F0A|nr:ABC transporter permease subunit [Paenibacillus silvisoli]